MLEPEKQRKSIVLVGSFNPSIYQPLWFSSNGIISNSDGASANVNVIHKEIVNFSLEWGAVEITGDRFVVSSTSDYAHEMIRDFAASTFRLLSHTPIRMLGINTEMHFRVANLDEWHTYGHKIAPKDLWDKVLIDPGTIKVELEGKRPDQYLGSVRVETGPSTQIQPGVFYRVNDHYRIVEEDEAVDGCSEIIDVLVEDWKNSIDRSNEIIEYIWNNR